MDRSNSPALCITWVYNEADILPWTVRHLLNQGIDVMLLDNNSTDASYDIARSFSVMYPDRVSVGRYPETPSDHTSWLDLLRITQRIALAQRGAYPWMIHQDADEIAITPTGETLADMVRRLDAAGYNAIDHEMNVMASRDGWDGFTDPDEFFNEFVPDIETYRAERQREVKVWKQPAMEVDLAHNGGHTVQFDGVKIAPERFLKFHYPMRGREHALRKVESRKARFAGADFERGWHSHYDQHLAQCVGKV